MNVTPGVQKDYTESSLQMWEDAMKTNIDIYWVGQKPRLVFSLYNGSSSALLSLTSTTATAVHTLKKLSELVNFCTAN